MTAGAPRTTGASVTEGRSPVLDAFVDEVELLHGHLTAALGRQGGADPLLRLRILEHQAQHLLPGLVEQDDGDGPRLVLAVSPCGEPGEDVGRPDETALQGYLVELV